MRSFAILAAPLLLCTLAACSPVRLLNAVVPDEGYTLRSDLAYGQRERQKLDIYVPDGLEAPAPVVVFFYGGSWQRGDRQSYRFIGEALSRAGIVTVIPDYRTYPEVRFPEFVHDGAAAVAWTRAQIAEHGGNPDHIVLMGHSAGAHIAALLALDEDYLAAVDMRPSDLAGLVGVAGPYAFDPLAYRSTRPIFAHLTDTDQALPVTFANQTAPPTLLLHGNNDRTVLPLNSERLATRLRTAGADVTYLPLADTGHIGIILSYAARFRGRDPVHAETVEFVRGL